MDRSELSQKVREAQKGNVAAFKDLFCAYCRPLTRYACRLTGNKEEAEDIVQEAMIKAYRSLGKLRHPERFDAWMYRIVTNKIKDRLDQMAKQNVSLDEEASASIRDATAEPNDDVAFLQILVDQLPQRLQIACLLFYWEGFSCREAGAIMRTTERTVRVLLYQARQKLRETFEEKSRA
jgi:RNA polymerase sigma-70 factor (ECF subfamily)